MFKLVIMRSTILFISIAGLFLQGCTSNSANSANDENASRKNKGKSVALSKDFKDYWYSGKAELSSFKLEQARYGQLNEGEAVLIFVTEDFLTEKQVKHEHGKNNASANVLKLNKIKRFQTGMYDYSMMKSVFTPVQRYQYPHSLKLTTSAQDWCGHAYLQMNNRDGRYRWQGFSYFQDEVHEDYKTDTVWLEDEVWTKLKLAPNSLPTGEVKMIPGSIFKRLRHRKLDPEKAVIEQKAYEQKNNNFEGEGLMVYRIHYPEIKRTLSIIYEKSFPHLIQGWIDEHKSGFGDNAKTLKTTAIRQKTLRTDYWSKHGLQDSTWRKRLGISDFRK